MNARGSPNTGAGSGWALTRPRAAALKPAKPARAARSARPGRQAQPSLTGRSDSAAEARREAHENASRVVDLAVADRDVKVAVSAMSVGGLRDQSPGSVEARRHCGRSGRNARGDKSTCENENVHAMADHYLLPLLADNKQ